LNEAAVEGSEARGQHRVFAALAAVAALCGKFLSVPSSLDSDEGSFTDPRWSASGSSPSRGRWPRVPRWWISPSGGPFGLTMSFLLEWATTRAPRS